MGEFEIFTKEIEINDRNGNKQKYLLRPLSGDYLPQFMEVVGNIASESSSDTTDIKIVLNKDSIKTFHQIALETFKKSYPKMDIAILDEFVSQNLLQLIEPLVSVNIQGLKELNKK